MTTCLSGFSWAVILCRYGGEKKERSRRKTGSRSGRRLGEGGKKGEQKLHGIDWKGVQKEDARGTRLTVQLY